MPCSHVEVYINWYAPPFFASDITQQLMGHASMCYTELIDDRFKKNLSRNVLKSVMHRSVKCLVFMRNEPRPTLDYPFEDET